MSAVTIIIRAKNEEFWLRRLLAQIKIQKFKDYEMVLVDNKSTDKTCEIFKKFSPDGKILEIEDFKPGKAINLGISASHTPLVVILSAHCVPVDENWLSSFIEMMEDQNIAAAYGRQVPLPTSHPLDKRDLLNTFGIERRIQKKDTFFHNANSIIRKKVWEKFPFDEETPHIEDRLWAGQIIQNGLFIAYEPEAAVYHHHGINHHSDTGRAYVISDILTKHTLENGNEIPEFLLPSSSSTLYCFLGHDDSTDKKFKTFVQAMQTQCPVGKYIVHSRNPKNIVGQEVVIEVMTHTREDEECTFVEILKKMLHYSYHQSFFPDCIVCINLRLSNIRLQYIMESVNYFYQGMYDSVFFAQQEYANVWQKNGDGYQQLRPDYARREKKDPVYISRYGLGLATKPALVEKGLLVGTNVAILSL